MVENKKNKKGLFALFIFLIILATITISAPAWALTEYNLTNTAGFCDQYSAGECNVTSARTIADDLIIKDKKLRDGKIQKVYHTLMSETIKETRRTIEMAMEIQEKELQRYKEINEKYNKKE